MHMRVCVCVHCLWLIMISLWTRWCFCWLIPASPHACLTTLSSSLQASCPNQFICKQVCFFPLRPIVHTTPECMHNGRPLSPSLLLYSKVENIVFYYQIHNANKWLASWWGLKKYEVLKWHYHTCKKSKWHLVSCVWKIGLYTLKHPINAMQCTLVEPTYSRWMSCIVIMCALGWNGCLCLSCPRYTML